MRRAATITARCLAGLFVVVLLVMAGLLGYARHQGLLMLSIQTGSMRPAIQPGDVVLVSQRTDELRVDDIVTYQSPQNAKATITHRIVAIDRVTGRVTTKGDTLTQPDPAVGRDQIVGVVTRAVPAAGYALDTLRQPYGLAAAVYLPAMFLAYSEIRRLMQYYDRQHYRLYSY